MTGGRRGPATSLIHARSTIREQFHHGGGAGGRPSRTRTLHVFRGSGRISCSIWEGNDVRGFTSSVRSFSGSIGDPADCVGRGLRRIYAPLGIRTRFAGHHDSSTAFLMVSPGVNVSASGRFQRAVQNIAAACFRRDSASTNRRRSRVSVPDVPTGVGLTARRSAPRILVSSTRGGQSRHQ